MAAKSTSKRTRTKSGATSTKTDRKQLVGLLSGRIKVPEQPPAKAISKGVRSKGKQRDAWDMTELERLSADPSMISDEPQLRIMSVNAGQAQQWLQSAARNRKLDGRQVTKYASQMVRGDWNPEHPEAIVFNKEGRLIDGQYRLAAVMKAAETEGEQFFVRFVLLLGFPNEAQYVMNTGKARTIAQTAFIREIDASSSDIAITKALWISPDPKKARIPGINDVPKVLSVFDKYSDGIKLASVRYGKRESVSSAIVRSVVARAYYFYCVPEGPGGHRDKKQCEGNKELLQRFLFILDTGLPEGRDEHTPAILRRVYQSSPARLKKTKLEIYRKAIFAVKAYMEGDEVERLRQSYKQEFPLKGFSPDEEDE